MNSIDAFLNKITMYRLVVYYLATLLVAAGIYGLFGMLSINPADLVFSTTVILAVCVGINSIFARTFKATPNVESIYITALILALIISPVSPTDGTGIMFLVFASAWAMASKYVFAIQAKHVFNPAAFGVALAGLVLGGHVTWWVGGNIPLLPLVLIGGLLIVRKIHRFDLVLSFAATTLLLTAYISQSGPVFAVSQALLHSSLLFFGLVMLTEPLTMPPTRRGRIFYGALVGLLFAPSVHIGSYYFAPEVAILIGNVLVYFISPKGRTTLTLLEKKEIALNTYEFLFSPNRKIGFLPGQYLEWTLAPHQADNRGNRRYFTIASSPTEPNGNIRLGVRFSEPQSTFKRDLLAMQPGDTISAAHLAGDFVLPQKKDAKFVFIAGGIGITPFRSMVEYMVDTHDTRKATLLYSNKAQAEIAYRDVFDRAKNEIGLQTIYALTNEAAPVPGTYSGFIDNTLIAREITDYTDRIFYISGPHTMVETFKKTLHKMGIPHSRIKTDYFPGFA